MKRDYLVEKTRSEIEQIDETTYRVHCPDKQDIRILNYRLACSTELVLIGGWGIDPDNEGYIGCVSEH